MDQKYRVKDFALADIFECGQCFRWERCADGSYEGIAGTHPAKVFFEPSAGDRYAGLLTVTGFDREDPEICLISGRIISISDVIMARSKPIFQSVTGLYKRR